MTGRDMTDEAVRAELERMNDSSLLEAWDKNDCLCGKIEPKCNCEMHRFLRLLAESQQALGDCIAIMEQFYPDMDAPRLLEYNADLSGQIEIARKHWKGEK